jgi:hypothetical protein
MVGSAYIIKTQQLARRVVELVMVDLDVRQSSVELDIHVALPGRKLYGRHIEM